MNIETYSDKYRDDVAEIVRNFYKEAVCSYDIGLDEKRMMETIASFDGNSFGQTFLLIIEGKCQGVLAGIEVPAMLNTKRIFQEVIWYVNKPYRISGIMLLKKAEELLCAQGFNVIIMACLEGSNREKIMKFYEQMNYKKFEYHFIKEL